MKKLFALPLAALVFAACSESTDPSAVADATPAYAKPGTTPPTGTGCSTCTLDVLHDFETGSVGIVGGTTIGTELEEGGAGSVSAATVVEAPSGEMFLGRFENVDTRVVINIPAGYPRYTLDFDFYTIGSWDGRGKQAQNGVFLANVFQIGYRCVPGAPISIFQTTFSNQLTVQQDYPLPYLTGGNKAATGSFAQDALEYRWEVPATSNTPTFRSFGDVSYHMTYADANPCGTAAVSFIISTSAPNQQSNYDESWGIDNVRIRAGT